MTCERQGAGDEERVSKAAGTGPSASSTNDFRTFMRLCESGHYLPMGELSDGRLYLINARNSYIGAWSARKECFTIRRQKFSRVYLFQEYHWDSLKDGEPFGTAKPYLLLPDAMPDDGHLEFLEWLEGKYPYDEALRRMLDAESAIGYARSAGQGGPTDA